MYAFKYFLYQLRVAAGAAGAKCVRRWGQHNVRAVPAVRMVLTPPSGWTLARTPSIVRSLSLWASRGRFCAPGSIGGRLFDDTHPLVACCHRMS